MMMMSGARDAELTTFRGSFMPRLRPAQPQSFRSAESFQIFDDDDVVEPSDHEEDGKEAAGAFRSAETPTTCPGCLAGDHGNAKTHTKEPGCRLYEMQSIRERKELVGLLEREEKLVQEQEKLEKLRRLREEMSPGAASKSDDGLRIPSAPPAPSEREALKSEMRSIIREELRDLMREERERIAGRDGSEASATPSRPSATEERVGGEAAKPKGSRPAQPIIHVHVPPQHVEVKAKLEKEEKDEGEVNNKIGGDVDKFKLDRLRFASDDVEGNPVKLEKFITRLKLATSQVGGDLAESMVDECLVAGQVYVMQYSTIPEHEREDVEVPMASLTRGQERCHQRFVKPILERLPDDVVKEAESRGRARPGGKPRLEDVFAILYRDMGINCIDDRLAQLKAVEGLIATPKNDALYSFLTEYRATVENLFTSGVVSEAYDCSKMYDVIRRVTRNRNRDFDHVVRNYEEKISHVGLESVSKDELMAYLRTMTGFARKHVRRQVNAQSSQETQNLCGYCKKGPHREKDCRTKKKDEEEKKEKEEKAKKEAAELEKKRKEEAALSQATQKNAKARGKGAKDGMPTFPCKLLVHGKPCNYGDQCNFSHDDALVKRFQQAECPHGKGCAFKDVGSGCIYGRHNLPAPTSQDTVRED